MSIAMTQHAMGYTRISQTLDRCESCWHSAPYEGHQPPNWIGRATLRCSKGGFVVSQIGSCNQFKQALVPIGPTDV